MRILIKFYKILFPKKINGKKWIEDSMSEKYGNDWFDQLEDVLKDKNLCSQMAIVLKLKNKDK
jgi:hypothetical protein